MPQASDADRARYVERFGDIGCEHAVAELERRGYVLTHDWNWIAPHQPTGEELFWLGFLVDEWDFGWVRKAGGSMKGQVQFVEITVNPEVGVAYVRMKQGSVGHGEAARTIRAEDFILDLDGDGRLIGMEVLNADALPEAWQYWKR